jgi:hypothetical protein
MFAVLPARIALRQTGSVSLSYGFFIAPPLFLTEEHLPDKFIRILDFLDGS